MGEEIPHGNAQRNQQHHQHNDGRQHAAALLPRPQAQGRPLAGRPGASQSKSLLALNTRMAGVSAPTKDAVDGVQRSRGAALACVRRLGKAAHIHAVAMATAI